MGNFIIHAKWHIAVLLTIILILAAVLVSLFGWGVNQALTPQIVQAKVRKGMSIEQVESALALSPEYLSRQIDINRKKERTIFVSRSGIVGSWFFPQHNILLTFDETNHLLRCGYEVHWRADEEYAQCDIR